MNTQKSAPNSLPKNAESNTLTKQGETALNNFVKVWNARADFFADAFVSKVKERNKKALAELQKHPLPPTVMDLRSELGFCFEAGVSDDQVFAMKNNQIFTLRERSRTSR